MRRILSLAFSLALLPTFGPGLQAQDVTGTWELTTTTQRGERTMTVVLAQEGTTVTGTLQMPAMARRGGAGAGQPANREIEISEGSFVDGVLTFSFTMGRGERSFTQTYKATTVTAEAMEGTVTGSFRAGEPQPFKGVKKEG